ncbi:aldo/keto reductase [Caldivirga maquilingensis]|uniref:Aldo/keto reductase n=1 Tax=Caldivirga maquilingensis (strain ATCC 700844 / DSM 13496 / JCM 10307 / IC-167) TaxID=397948 RepID=A8MBT2_CALMQ|nr:aldo/keto reductase [Caldivirga maquilingensis]ABW01275.1 aldo/keto reductase [Caldivirga maquilingensis IC-167]
MEYVNLGNSGLKISRICLGAMQFGNTAPWMVELEDARKVWKKAWDLGINCIDTANVYSRGRSEEIVGELVKGMREDVVIATKVFGQMGNGPNARGLSRKHIMWQVRESLRRLNTGYIDLYQIHRFDYDTPIEETLSTLTDLVHQGLVRYIGASSMWTWQFAKMIYTAEMKGYEKFVSMQNVYNLLYREEEREMIPFCKAHGIGIIPWSPTAAGILSGKYYKDGKIIVPETETRVRPGSGDYRIYVEPPENAEILRRVIEVANNKGATPTQIAYAWLLHKGVTAPIIGTTKPEHVEEAVNAISIKLTDDEVKYLEEPYKPKPVFGHR